MLFTRWARSGSASQDGTGAEWRVKRTDAQTFCEALPATKAACRHTHVSINAGRLGLGSNSASATPTVKHGG
jgi:hypothetical protein